MAIAIVERDASRYLRHKRCSVNVQAARPLCLRCLRHATHRSLSPRHISKLGVLATAVAEVCIALGLGSEARQGKFD